MTSLDRKIAEVILYGSMDAVVCTDLDGKITFWNPAATRIFGFAEDDALGRSLDLIIPPAMRARHWSGYHEVMQTGRSRYSAGETLSVPALNKEGARISVEFTMAVIRDDAGRLSGAVAIMRDVSKRFEEMQSLKRKLTAATVPS
ncbi:MAG: PAS domain-containing protein [Hyphomicrobiales bacterium]|nr:PAS domain-containing protein [Hyphomicrobiales bacterium]